MVDYVRNPDRIPLILQALERRWREDPDQRLCQLLVNLTRDLGSAPSSIWGVEDGELLRRLGPRTEAESRYVAEEPAARRQGWNE
jgi:hypothetical protein